MVADPLSEYALNLTAMNGLSNRDPIRFTIKGVEDRPPDITVKDPLGDQFVTDLCERPLEIEVKDDHGIARIALEYRVLSQQQGKSKDWTGVEFNREQASREYRRVLIKRVRALNIGAMGLQPGDRRAPLPGRGLQGRGAGATCGFQGPQDVDRERPGRSRRSCRTPSKRRSDPLKNRSCAGYGVGAGRAG
jgi:hypothetical protein